MAPLQGKANNSVLGEGACYPCQILEGIQKLGGEKGPCRAGRDGGMTFPFHPKGNAAAFLASVHMDGFGAARVGFPENPADLLRGGFGEGLRYFPGRGFGRLQRGGALVKTPEEALQIRFGHKDAIDPEVHPVVPEGMHPFQVGGIRYRHRQGGVLEGKRRQAQAPGFGFADDPDHGVPFPGVKIRGFPAGEIVLARQGGKELIPGEAVLTDQELPDGEGPPRFHGLFQGLFANQPHFQKNFFKGLMFFVSGENPVEIQGGDEMKIAQDFSDASGGALGHFLPEVGLGNHPQAKGQFPQERTVHLVFQEGLDVLIRQIPPGHQGFLQREAGRLAAAAFRQALGGKTPPDDGEVSHGAPDIGMLQKMLELLPGEAPLLDQTSSEGEGLFRFLEGKGLGKIGASDEPFLHQKVPDFYRRVRRMVCFRPFQHPVRRLLLPAYRM